VCRRLEKALSIWWIERHGLFKDSRCGYSVELNYPPDWGERTISLRSTDATVLQPDMTIHFMPGI
jgi:Xaa-Pro aminopeptidase